MSGDGGAATSAELSFPTAVMPTADGGYYIADQVNHRVRRVDAGGQISTFAGTTQGFNDGPVSSAQFNAPSGLAILPDRSLLVADANNNRVRRIASGAVSTVAGGGGSLGDGGPATSGQLAFPFDVAAIDQSSYLIADEDNNRVRLVSNGTITTVAGTGSAGFAGDNGPSTAAQLDHPTGIALLPGGGFLIADRVNDRVRKVSSVTGGTIITVAGGGTTLGDGGQATAAQLNLPQHLAALPDGGYLIADAGNHRVRHVAADGTISTVAGTGAGGYNGDGILANTAQLNQPYGVGLTFDNDYLIADAFNQRIRRVDAGDPNLPPPLPPSFPPPVFGKRVNVSLVSGRVTVSVPGTGGLARGASARATRFVPLRGLRQIPVGSFLNTSRGTVRLSSATSTGRIQTGDFSGGTFKVLQNRRLGGLTDLNLSGGSFRRCRRRPSRRAVAAASRTVRRLRGRARGRFRTRGRFSAATVRGTNWSVADRCDGTLTHVTSGVVTVSDFRKHRNITVRAHHSYLARGG